MRTIIIKATEIRKAIERAHKVNSRNWQAECIEILLIPKVYKRWQKVNAKSYQQVTIKRHKGQTYTNDIDGRKVKDWSIFAGYVYTYGIPDSDYGWNSVRKTSYSHSASTTWDGIRRETYHSFAENLRHLYFALVDERVKVRQGYVESQLWQYNIHFYNDLDGNVAEGYHGFEEFYTEAEAICKLGYETAWLGNRVKHSRIEKMKMSGMWRITIESTKKPNLQYVSRKMIAAQCT